MACPDTRLRPERHDAGADLCLEAHRRELRAHCRQVLGSAFEAEDAVQETFVRAWRSLDQLESPAHLRTWLYRIATNVCCSMVRGPQRRARPMDLDADRAGAERPAVGGAVEVTPDPAELVESREDVRRALVVALRTLPARQRAVVILRDVLRWRASEVAELLGTTAAAVNSAHQRARATLAARAESETGTEADAGAGAGAPPGHDLPPQLLDRFVAAFEHADVPSLVALLRVDPDQAVAATAG